MVDEVAIKKVMANVLKVAPEAITEESSQDTIPGWDSLRHMNLVLALESEFGIMIPDEDAPNITSYPLVRLVIKELTEQ